MSEVGKVKLDLCEKLGKNHYDLADYFNIPRRDSAKWESGRECQEIIEWLENNDKLNQLPEALEYIKRENLVTEALRTICNQQKVSSHEKNLVEAKPEEQDITDILTSELSQENLAGGDSNNIDLVASSELNFDLETQELMPPEQTVEEVEEEYADTPIEEMRVTEDGKPTLFALWEIALQRDLNSEVNLEAKEFLKMMYKKSKQARSALTEIQEKLRKDCKNIESEISDKPFHSNLNVVISAPTSSGKSTLAEIFLAIPSFRYDERKCAIYIAPTRALTQAKYRDLKNLFSGYEDYFGEIVLSTGEDITDDWRINSADFSIACMVYEKANILFSQKPTLLESLGCIVVDEMHMIADLQRGPVLEMALTKALFHQTEKNTAAEAIRIVLISTEEKPKLDIINFLSVRQNGDWEHPLSFCDDDREVSVEHKLVLASKKEKTTEKFSYEEILITHFKNNQQRQLSEKNITNIEQKLFNLREKLVAKNTSEQKSSREFDNRLIELIIDLLLKQPKGYRILVFVPGRQDAENKASQLKNKLELYHTHKDDEKYAFLGDKNRHKDLTEKFQELLKNAEDTRMARTLNRCIEFGIFVHHSDIERKIRTEIEETCSEVYPDMSSQVIFATETLSYGINLAVQDVILYGVKFYAQSRFVQSELKLVKLSVSSYHNMIGRAGRKGKGDSGKAHAYILVPQGSNPIRNIVREYYETIDHPVKSTLYHQEDKKVQYDAEDDLKNQNSEQPENECAKFASLGAANFSYPFARSILDALRHLNIGDNDGNQKNKIRIRRTKESIFNFLNRTLYRKTTQLLINQKDKQREQNLFHCAIERILDDCSSDQLQLVEKTPVKDESQTCYYEITSLGESIIDTGTEISTVGQLRKIVNSIHSLWDEYYRSYHPDFPMELYLLCIIAQEEVFRDYIRYTPECKTNKQGQKWSNELAKENPLRVNSRLKEYLVKLPQMKNLSDEQSTELIKELRHQILNPWNALRQKSEENYEYGASDTILRLFTGILAWIDGKDRDEVYKIIEGDNLDKNMQGTMQKLRHFTEVLSYKILFLSKILEKLRKTDSIKTSEIESERELRILASRLRFGCTSKAVPFFKPSSSSISRKQAKDMLNDGITPRSMLIANLDLNKFDMSDKLKLLLKKDIEKDACGSFQRLADDLTSGIDKDEKKRTSTKKLVQEMPKLFRKSVESFMTTIKIPIESEESEESFDSKLRKELGYLRLEDGTQVPNSAGQEARLNHYKVKIEIFSGPVGIAWHGQQAKTSLSEKESDEERELEYIDQHIIKIVGIQFNYRWDCQINKNNGDFTQFLNQHENTEHIAIVPLPWIPSEDELPTKIDTCLKLRFEKGRTTTFITPAAFAAMQVFIVRNFEHLEDYSEDFTKLLVRPPRSSSNFNVVTVEDVRRVMRQRSNDVPSGIMQALLEHFEADGDV